MKATDKYSELVDLMIPFLRKVYHPQDYSETTIQQIADSAFDVANFQAQVQYPDQFKEIEQSTLEALRDDIREEVIRRICRDPHVLRLNTMRDELIGLIRAAVEKEKGIIGTFYQNRGVHFQYETYTPEYMDSPIVVNHNTSYNRYGGFESNTLYELFINTDGKLLCTLNGEAGEDFIEPIEHIQVEGLITIVQWLREYGFHTDDPWRCEECGSMDVQDQIWIDSNTGEIAIGAQDKSELYCNACETHTFHIRESELLEQIRAWFDTADIYRLEYASGLERTAFESERLFRVACLKIWNQMSVADKISVWEEND